MSRHLDYRDLEPLERRVGLMRASGLSEAAIGKFLDCDYMTVSAILKRPRVARFLLALESTFVEQINPATVDNINEAIEQTAKRAFEIEKTVMESLHAVEREEKGWIRAQLGAAATAQDILDRAGKRAPARTLAEIQHTVDPAALSQIADVLHEVADMQRAIDVTPDGNGQGP